MIGCLEDSVLPSVIRAMTLHHTSVPQLFGHVVPVENGSHGITGQIVQVSE